MKLYIYDGVRYLISPDATVDQLHADLPAIKADIATMMATQSGDQKWFNREEKWKIRDVHGEITVVYAAGGRKGKKVLKEEKEKTESSSTSYVLLVELGEPPGGFAIFTPSGEGEGPNGSGVVNLRFVGWTNGVAQNLDPPGLIGQPTNRLGWCKAETPTLSVEQVKRVDQGMYAYYGDERYEEVTGNYTSDNIWTYEGITYPTHWVSVIPGPPPPEICGYTWAIDPEYGGEEADFHDTRHLFYTVESGNRIIYFWPPEFNQFIEKYQYWHEEAIVCKYKYALRDEIWEDGPRVGLDKACESFMFPNTFGKISAILDDTVRIWGNVWGNIYFPPEDRTVNSFPYTTYSYIRGMKVETVRSDYSRFYDSSGVYVAEDGEIPRMFIQGCKRYDGGTVTYSQDMYRYYKREAIDIDTRFDAAVAAALSDRQRQLLEGNEGSVSPWPPSDPYTGLSYIESYTNHYEEGDIVVNCGGLEYMVKLRGNSGEFMDYGIFTKVNTGIDREGNVDPDTVVPIYAYSVNPSPDHDIKKCIYGMVLDGRHYRTDEFDVSNWRVTIPGCEDAVSRDGTQLYGTYNVRIGIMTSKQEQEATRMSPVEEDEA